jgi:hypothetical protein
MPQVLSFLVGLEEFEIDVDLVNSGPTRMQATGLRPANSGESQ